MSAIRLKITANSTQIEQMARQFGLPAGTQRLEIPPALGSGFCQFYQLPYQVQCHHYQYNISQRLEVIGENEVEDGLYMVHINLSNSILNKQIGADQYDLSQHGQTGALFYAPGYHSAGSNVPNMPYELVFFAFPKTTFQQLLPSLTLNEQRFQEQFCYYTELKPELKQALKAALSSSNSNLFTQQGILLQVLGQILQQFAQGENNINASRLKMQDVNLQLQVKELLEQHLTQQAPSIEHLAKQFSIGKTKLKTDFKALFGTSIYQYYLQQKMLLAKQLLLNKEGTVAEIGYRLGYSNVAQFSQQFKKQFQVSPSQI